MKEVKYTYHHTASDRGYIPVGKEIKDRIKVDTEEVML
jgi:hypothetical protein|nr:MAG TPA: hypothetical protein [Caudoviricetes sp.]